MVGGGELVCEREAIAYGVTIALYVGESAIIVRVLAIVWAMRPAPRIATLSGRAVSVPPVVASGWDWMESVIMAAFLMETFQCGARPHYSHRRRFAARATPHDAQRVV